MQLRKGQIFYKLLKKGCFLKVLEFLGFFDFGDFRDLANFGDFGDFEKQKNEMGPFKCPGK